MESANGWLNRPRPDAAPAGTDWQAPFAALPLEHGAGGRFHHCVKVVGAFARLFEFRAVHADNSARAGVSTKPADGTLVELELR